MMSKYVYFKMISIIQQHFTNEFLSDDIKQYRRSCKISINGVEQVLIFNSQT